jgi:hypothetical protein
MTSTGAEVKGGRTSARQSFRALRPERGRVAAVALSVAPPIALGVLLFAVRHNTYWLGACWGLAMLLSLHGWGLAVESLVRPRERIDVGLSFSWGLAATLFLGGVGCALHMAARPFLIGQVAVGSLLSIGFRAKRWRPAPSRRRIFRAIAQPLPYLFVFAVMVLPAINYVGLVGDYKFNLADDQALYMLEAEKIVQTGLSFDPFNSRRVALYGGIDYLNAQFIAVGKAYQLHVVDGGVGMLMLFALVVGAAARRGLRRTNLAYLAFPLLLLATVGDVSINIGSLVTGAAAFLGVYRTFLLVNEAMDDPASGDENMALRLLAVLGACVMATWALRPTNAIPAAVFVTLALARRRMPAMPRGTGKAIWLSLRDATFVGLSCLVSVAPWLVVFHESVGSFAYPFMKGNATPGFVLVKAEPGLAYNLKHWISDLSYPVPINTSFVFLTAGILPLGWTALRSRRTDFVPLLSVVCCVALGFTSYMSGVCDDWVNARYLYGFLVGTVLVITTSLVPSETPYKFGASPRALLVAAALMGHIGWMHDTLKSTALRRVDQFESATTKWREDAAGAQEGVQHYLDVQAHVPEHQSVAVVVNEPCWFDMRRNQVYSLDNSPGGLGPKPGFPIFKGPKVLEDYLQHNGVRYLIVSSFHDVINVDSWRGFVQTPHSYMGYEAPIVVDALESLEKIVKSRHPIYENFGMKVIDLQSAPGE